jgi:choline dehydrogenase
MIVRGSRGDYDEWAPFSDGRWDSASLGPYLISAEATFRTRRRADDEMGPWDRAFVNAAVELGYPVKDDFNDPDEGELIARWPINAVGAVRWNASFAYLDPARGRDNLVIISDALIDRLEVRGSGGTRVRVIHDGLAVTLSADLVIVAAGAYGSPAILQRSGIGPEALLHRLAIPLVHRLEGVGENLIDHPGSGMVVAASPRLQTELLATKQPMYASVVIAKARSRAESDSWDLHLICWTYMTNTEEGGQASADFCIFPKLMKPKSIGRVTLATADPTQLPVIDHGFLSDPGGEDAARLADSIRICRRLLATRAMSEFVTGELSPGSSVASDSELDAYIRAEVGGYYHPVGTCRLGVEGDPMAVVDASLRIHGLDNVMVADASVMPTIPRANTNLTVAAIAERFAAIVTKRDLSAAGSAPV